jgi:hypothetical protein
MSKRIDSIYLVYKFLFGIFFVQLVVSCSNGRTRFEERKKLAEVHCASCHMAPSPSSLPLNTWANDVLPSMGIRMGKFHHGKVAYNNPLISAGKSTISQEDWEKIVRYYITSSPKELDVPEEEDKEVSNLFKSEVFPSSPKLSSMITMISFDKESQKLLLGEAHKSYLVTVDLEGKIIKGTPTNSPPVKVFKKDSLEYLLGIGSLPPSDDSNGFLRISKDKIYGLTRPVDFLVDDINNDGYDDVFICNFGYSEGDFSLYKNLKNGSYEKEIIHPLSGAIRVEYENMDEDEEKEIVVLFTQEHESLMVWDVETGGSFKGEKILQFQPEYGATDFQLKDIDNDGDKDIIISNGDNADYSRVLKDYHGIRIYLNEGNKKFTEVYYAAMHGASKVEVEDFDLDGDLDILMISNFGNLSDPKFKSVQLLRNDGELNFKREFIKDLPNYRWQTIDVTDFDSDGDLDVFIGAFSINIGPKDSDVTKDNEISWVKLENLIR